jgi:hypothetical protein
MPEASSGRINEGEFDASGTELVNKNEDIVLGAVESGAVACLFGGRKVGL